MLLQLLLRNHNTLQCKSLQTTSPGLDETTRMPALGSCTMPNLDSTNLQTPAVGVQFARNKTSEPLRCFKEALQMISKDLQSLQPRFRLAEDRLQ